MPIRVLIADDHPLVHKGLREMLLVKVSREFAIVGEAMNGNEAVELYRKKHPDVVLMDAEMPSGSGDVATRVLCDELDAKVLPISGHADGDHILAMLHAGGKGYLLKGSSSEETREAKLLTVTVGVWQKAPWPINRHRVGMCHIQLLSSGASETTTGRQQFVVA